MICGVGTSRPPAAAWSRSQRSWTFEHLVRRFGVEPPLAPVLELLPRRNVEPLPRLGGHDRKSASEQPRLQDRRFLGSPLGFAFGPKPVSGSHDSLLCPGRDPGPKLQKSVQRCLARALV